MQYYSAIKRNTLESVLIRWMNTEPIIQSKVSQKEKNKYHILTHIYMESRRILVMNLFSEQQWRCRYTEQTMDKGGGEEGAGEINGECSMEAYTLVHVN